MRVALGIDNLFDEDAPNVASWIDANTDTMTSITGFADQGIVRQGAPLARLKWLHTTSNRPQLNRAMREKESVLRRTLMNWNPPHESLDLSPLQE